MNLLNKKLLKKHKNLIDIKNITVNGFALDTIVETTKNQKSDLVVMGIKNSGKVGEMVFGSVASDAAGKISCPLLIIPDGISFTIPKKIVFAYDNNPISIASLNFLKDITSIFKSELYILNIIDLKSKIKDGAISKIEEQFAGLKHKLYVVENDLGDIVDEINKFSDKKSIDLVVMVARKHSFLNKLFHERKTKKMAFHTQIPLLVLNDKN